MLTRIIRFGLGFALLATPALAQETESPAPPPRKAQKPAAPAPGKPPAKQASAGAEEGKESKPVALNADGDEVKVLKPQDVPAELLRVKSKADMKVEVTIVPAHGRPVVVKGVVRNGKLIERFVGRRFQPEKNIDHPHSGIRLWWVNNTAGWIFLRYSQVQTLSLTGTLTAEEREEIMRALKAQGDKKEEEKRIDEAAKLDDELQKMSPAELETYLLRQYPAEKGWTYERQRDLKKKQLVDNQPLTLEENVFVTYFPALIKARMKELKTHTKKVEFEPGSAERKPEPRPVEGKPIEDPSLESDAPAGSDDWPAPEDDEDDTGDEGEG